MFSLKHFLVTAAAAGTAYGICGAASPTGSISSSEQLFSSMRQKIESIESLSFGFTQKTFIADSTHTVKADVYYRRPGYLLIDYSKPQQQQVLLKDGKLYTYIPAIKQATRQPAGNIENILGTAPSIIVSTRAVSEFEKKFKSHIDEKHSDHRILLLVSQPRIPVNYKRIEISIDRDTLFPVISKLYSENFESITLYSSYKVNVPMKDSLFEINKDPAIKIIEIE